MRTFGVFALCFAICFAACAQRAFTGTNVVDAARSEAFIGSRFSLAAGEKSSLRWLQNLLEKRPHAQQYVVEWLWVKRGGVINMATVYDAENRTLELVASRHLAWEDRSFAPVSRAQIRRARSFAAFPYRHFEDS